MTTKSEALGAALDAVGISPASAAVVSMYCEAQYTPQAATILVVALHFALLEAVSDNPEVERFIDRMGVIADAIKVGLG